MSTSTVADIIQYDISKQVESYSVSWTKISAFPTAAILPGSKWRFKGQHIWSNYTSPIPLKVPSRKLGINFSIHFHGAKRSDSFLISWRRNIVPFWTYMSAFWGAFVSWSTTFPSSPKIKKNYLTWCFWFPWTKAGLIASMFVERHHYMHAMSHTMKHDCWAARRWKYSCAYNVMLCFLLKDLVQISCDQWPRRGRRLSQTAPLAQLNRVQRPKIGYRLLQNMKQDDYKANISTSVRRILCSMFVRFERVRHHH